ncbi:MAG TPA: triacylglycerol lipase [Longimicrobium sp.]
MHRIRSSAALVVAALTLAACDGDVLTGTQASFARTPTTTTRHPVLFVHGWNSSASTWNTMVARFKADGWTDAQLMAFSYNTSQSNATTAAEIATRVDQLLAANGATKVDIVTHSMGGLSSRYYAKNLGGDVKIDAWVSLGGPNHGTTTASACFSTACAEMRIGSTFLAALNAGDETPGVPRYATWWSGCDEVINPDDSVLLSGATNTQTVCLSHGALHEDAGVYRSVRDFVSR